MGSAGFYRVILFLLFFWAGLPRICPALQAPAQENARFSLILIDLTCLRADHLSCYGYSRQTSPNIDKLARQEIWFTQAVSQAYWTLPSVASVLTGKYVPAHKMENRNQRLGPKQKTLAEVLKSNGYKTAAFVGGLDLDVIHNLDRGFEVYSDDTGDKPMGSFAQIFPRAVQWLDRNGHSQFFLFLQGYDAHPPFVSGQGYENKFDPDYRGLLDRFRLDYGFLKSISSDTAVLDGQRVKLGKKDIEHIIAHYDGGISYVDSLLGDFLARLEKMGLDKKTVILIFADHGEALYDHGSFDRFGTADLYEEVAHVPLFIKHPAIKGVKVDHQVQLIDIFPSVLNLLDVYSPDKTQGKSFYPLITTGSAPDDSEFAFSGWGRKQMVRTAGWKLIFDGNDFELYNIVKDRHEKINCINNNVKTAARLAEQLFRWQVENNLISPLNKGRIPREDVPGIFQGESVSGEYDPASP
jgi:choline-sulfatase